MDENLRNKRHTLAHLLARAVLEFYPNASLTLGPAIDNGFYYDIDFHGETFSDKDLKKVENKMREIVRGWNSFTHKEVSKEEAEEIYRDNEYKLELIREISERGEKITLYTCGDFTDLCRGGHVDNPSEEINMKGMALDRVAGAYWRGDESNKMLTRIYGLYFDNANELKEFLENREKAKELDHRKIGKELNLFVFSDLVGGGLPLFTPEGSVMRDAVMDRIMSIQKEYGYKRVTTPHLTKNDLYKTSGHWDKFKDELFKVSGKSDEEFVMKPMNCPHHTQIYASRQRSYKDLPIRFMELGVVYRDEKAGELLGLSRVRAISQDDGHIFCRPDQIEEEIGIIIGIIRKFYEDLGMLEDGKYWLSVSVRDKGDLSKYIGDESVWDMSEEILESIAKKNGFDYKVVEGEAAFYGPKLDFQFQDALGRQWQLGTAQLDFNMPARFGLEYVDSDGSRKTPVMIHRAIAGSLERFMAVMIEHFGGDFPLWLSPVQIAIIPVSDEKHGDFAKKMCDSLSRGGVRCELLLSGSLGKRLTAVRKKKIPYYIVVGDKEVGNGEFAVERVSKTNGDLCAKSVEELIAEVRDNTELKM